MGCSLLLCLPLAATVAVAPPPDAPGTEIAFASVDTRMTVPVSVGGSGPFRFLIDTGAQRTVISHELAATLKLARGPVVRLIAMTGAAQVGTVLVPSLGVDEAATLRGSRIEAPALFQQHMGAAGILGVDTLQDNAVAIDFVKSSMTVRTSKKRKRRPSAGPEEIVVRAVNLFGQLVVTDATYRGTRIRVVLDTGTVVSMGNEALRRRIDRSRKPVRDIELMSVTGEKMIAGYTQIGQVRVGGAVFQNLPVAFSAEAPFKRFGLEDTPAILLGMDALRLFRRVDIDFANREVRLTLPRRGYGSVPRLTALPGDPPRG